MPFSESILSALVETIFSHVLEQSRAADWLRGHLGLDPVKRAYTHALKSTVTTFAAQYPDAEDWLFNEDFMRREAAPILAQFLIRDGYPNPHTLARCWADSLGIHDEEQRTARIHVITPQAAALLDLLGKALNAELSLAAINDSRALESILNRLAAVCRALKVDHATPETRRHYLHWLIERNRYLDLRGMVQTQRPVRVALDSVYISLQAQREETGSAVDRKLLEQELVELALRLEQTPLPSEDVEDQHEQVVALLRGRGIGTSSPGPGAMLELGEAVTRHEHLVVLGDPGSGKTTLTRYLALKHAQALATGHATVGDGLGPARFPILVRIADYAERDTWHHTSLSDFLVPHCTVHECPAPGLDDLLHTELARGSCLVLLDGLDEIANADARRTIVGRIEDFVRRYGNVGNHFVVTSRIAGYRNFPLGGLFVHYTVQEMRQEQMQRFLEHWCPAVEVGYTPDSSPEEQQVIARQEVAGILAAIERTPGVRSIAANPLLLCVLARIHRTGAPLPQKRIELYQEAADMLARDWRLTQGMSTAALELLQERYLTRLLRTLAYWLHVNKPTGLATEREVKAVLGAEWAAIKRVVWDADDPDPDISGQVDQFLCAVREHTGLFVERAPRRYGFMHRTFQEYYVARYLVARSSTRSQLIRQHFLHPRWEEPILLALGFVGMETPRAASQLVETAILAHGAGAAERGFMSSSYEHLLGRDFLFALRCVGDAIPIDPQLTRPLIKRLVTELTQRTGASQHRRYLLVLQDRLAALKHTDVVPMIIAELERALSEAPNLTVYWRAIASLTTFGPPVAPMVLPILAMALTSHDIVARSLALQNLAVLGPQIPDQVFPILRIALTNPDLLMHWHGAQAWIDLGPTLVDRIRTVLQEQLTNADSAMRLIAAYSLIHLNPPALDRALPVLHTAFSDPDPEVRRVVASIIADIPFNALTVVQPVLSDPDPEVRLLGAQAIAKQAWYGSDTLLDMLQNMLGDADPKMRRAAAEGLATAARFGHTRTFLFLHAALDDTDSIVRWHAARGLACSMPDALERVLPILQTELRNADLQMRWDSAQAIADLAPHDPATVLPILHAALNDRDIQVCWQAQYTLLALGQQHVDREALLLEGLSKADFWRVRQGFVDLVGKSRSVNDVMIDGLYRSLLDSMEFVRGAAARSLAQVGLRFPAVHETIAVKLAQALTDPAFAVCDNAARPGHAYAFDALWMLAAEDVSPYGG